MLKIDRQTAIERELSLNGSVRIPELSKMLNCSEETIRRDLKEMERADKLTRTHGGAFLMGEFDKSYPISVRQILLPDIKLKLAKRALNYITENDLLMLDSSTTCLALAEEIARTNLKVSVMTNSLKICDYVNEENVKLKLICTGGRFRSRTASFVGYSATDMISRYVSDCTFISCPKVTIENGMSDNHLDESNVRESMLKHSKKKILLMDHTKFNEPANVLFGDLSKVDVIITDKPLSAEWVKYCDTNCISLDVAGE